MSQRALHRYVTIFADKNERIAMITCKTCKQLNYDDMTFCFACKNPMYPVSYLDDGDGEDTANKPCENNERSDLLSHGISYIAQDGSGVPIVQAIEDKGDVVSHEQAVEERGEFQDSDLRCLPKKMADETETTCQHNGRICQLWVQPYQHQAYGYIPTQKSVLVGNSSLCDIVLPEVTRGKEVARLYLEHTYLLIEQMDAQTTTVVAGEPVTGIAHARMDEFIYIGKSALRYIQRREEY